MTKIFITYEEQLKKLMEEKHLIVKNKNYALETLKNISYYGLIGGYKYPFIDARSRKYKEGVKFEDVVSLYYFDEELRGLFFKYFCRIEGTMCSLISYHFTEEYGEKQEEYLASANYNSLPKYQEKIQKLLKLLSYMADESTDHEYLVYQRNKYHNVPLWVLMKALTFGQISHMYELLPQNMQGKICRNFTNVKKNEMLKYLKILTLYRNLCAHGERLFSYRTYNAIPDTILHRKLEIAKKGRTYANGKK